MKTCHTTIAQWESESSYLYHPTSPKKRLSGDCLFGWLPPLMGCWTTGLKTSFVVVKVSGGKKKPKPVSHSLQYMRLKEKKLLNAVINCVTYWAIKRRMSWDLILKQQKEGGSLKSHVFDFESRVISNRCNLSTAIMVMNKGFIRTSISTEQTLRQNILDYKRVGSMVIGWRTKVSNWHSYLLWCPTTHLWHRTTNKTKQQTRTFDILILHNTKTYLKQQKNMAKKYCDM